MKSINVKQHKALVEGLENLKKILDNYEKECLFKPELQEIDRSLLLLLNTFQKYESLLAQLYSMTEQYEVIHRRVRAKTLAPLLRNLKKNVEVDSPVYFLLRETLNSTKEL